MLFLLYYNYEILKPYVTEAIKDQDQIFQVLKDLKDIKGFGCNFIKNNQTIEK